MSYKANMYSHEVQRFRFDKLACPLMPSRTRAQLLRGKQTPLLLHAASVTIVITMPSSQEGAVPDAVDTHFRCVMHSRWKSDGHYTA
jgi:hypothetical protein